MENNLDKIAVLLMAYGSPNTLDEIEPYCTDIRGGRKPSPEYLQEIIGRYQRIGGRSPLLEITRNQAWALQHQLNATQDRFQVYLGMKHWHPTIAETMAEVQGDGLRRIIALVLAPHLSRAAFGEYIQRVQDSLAIFKDPPAVKLIPRWSDHPLFLKALGEKVEEGRRKFESSTGKEILVIFSAHSLPQRMLLPDDPYPQRLKETCEAVASLLSLRHWRLAFQSAGQTGEKWIGPDLLSTLTAVAEEGFLRVLIAPIGFVADHLEILYDIDILCAEHAGKLGVELRRADSLNTSPRFIAALATMIREQEAPA